MLFFFSQTLGLAWRVAALPILLLLAGSNAYGQQGSDNPLAPDSASTNFFLRVQRQVRPGDTLALDTLRIRAAVRHVDSLVHAAQLVEARRQRQQAREDSLRFRHDLRVVDQLLRTNGPLPESSRYFRLESTGADASVLRPTDQLELTLREEYTTLFRQLSRHSTTISTSIRTNRLRLRYVYSNAMIFRSAPLIFDSEVVAVLAPAAITEEQRRREAAFRPRNAAALKQLDLLYTQFYRLGKRPRFTKRQYSAFEQEHYFTEEARFTFRTQCIQQLATDLAKI